MTELYENVDSFYSGHLPVEFREVEEDREEEEAGRGEGKGEGVKNRSVSGRSIPKKSPFSKSSICRDSAGRFKSLFPRVYSK